MRGRARRPARARPAAPDRRLPAAPLLAHQGARRRRSARRSPPPTRSGCSTSTRRARSRSASSPASAGLQVAEAAADRAGGRPVWWLRDAERCRRAPWRPQAWTRATSLVHARRRRHLPGSPSPGRRTGADERPRPGSSATIPLARLTTVRAGGAADFFARPRDEEPARRAARVGERGGAGGRSGRLGLEPAGRGRWIPRPRRSSWTASSPRSSATASASSAGGGARLPSAAAKAAGWGLAGLEFGINIPGTVGGAVRMNANAYGGELARGPRVGRGRDRSGRPSAARPTQLGFGYRQLEPEPGRGRLPGLVPAEPRRARRDQGGWRRCGAQRREAQPSGIKTFGSTFKNPRRRARRGPHRGPAARGGRLPRAAASAAPASPPKHANFVENAGEATTADILELMAEGRRRVHERFGVVLEPEVQVLGEVDWPCGLAPRYADEASRAATASASRPLVSCEEFKASSRRGRDRAFRRTLLDCRGRYSALRRT